MFCTDGPQKTISQFVTDNDTICESIKGYFNYDPYYHTCVNDKKVSLNYGPIMGIDVSDPEKPFWYIFGFFNRKIEDLPLVISKVVPNLDWIFVTMSLDSVEDE